MDKQSILDRFKREVAISEERKKATEARIADLCNQLGYDPATVTVEQVEKDLEQKKAEQQERETKLQTLIDNYDKQFSSK